MALAIEAFKMPYNELLQIPVHEFSRLMEIKYKQVKKENELLKELEDK